METLADFVGGEFGDRRLSERFERIGGRLLEGPEASFPVAMKTQAELEGFYRFIHHERVSPETISAPHVAETLKRASEHRTLYVAHDTTELGFSTPREGLGRVTDAGRGFFAHASLLLSASGEALGVLHQETYTRHGKPRRKAGRHTETLPEAQKESGRWWRGVATCEAVLGRAGAVVHLADREADAYLCAHRMLESGARFVFRIRSNRRLEDDSLLFETMEKLSTQATREVHVQSRKGRGIRVTGRREARDAQLSIAAGTVTVKRPATPPVGEVLPDSLSLHVVHVREVEAPEGVKPVDWKLMTHEPIDTLEDVLAIVDAYRMRWRIEEFFKALKSGCRIEEVQLESLEGILNAVALYTPVACRIMGLRAAGRAPRSPPAHTLVTPLQIEVLQRHPDTHLKAQPSAKDAAEAVARLGGWIRNNGPPGYFVLARGFVQLLQLEAGARLFGAGKSAPADA